VDEPLCLAQDRTPSLYYDALGLERCDMTQRQVFVNGAWLAESNAQVSVFDRAYLMADAVYEVVAVLHGKLVDFDRHIARLQRSLDALQLPNPYSPEQWLTLCRTAVQKNQLSEGLIYWQVSRGVADRDFVWPTDVDPSVVLFTQAKPIGYELPANAGLRVITQPDQRWGRCDIKSIQLLFSSWAKMVARQAGKDDAWLVDAAGYVTEGTSSNAFIVRDRQIWTRPLSQDILPGVTRAAVMQCAEELNLTVMESAFTVAQALAADEAYITSATQLVMPVIELDGHTIGAGVAGPITTRLRSIYLEIATDRAI